MIYAWKIFRTSNEKFYVSGTYSPVNTINKRKRYEHIA